MIQYGIVSAGANTCGLHEGFPGVYVKVSEYLKWILESVDKFPNNSSMKTERTKEEIENCKNWDPNAEEDSLFGEKIDSKLALTLLG